MAFVKQPGNDDQICHEDAHTNPTLKAIGSMGWTTLQLNGALHHADPAFDAIAKALVLLEPILFFESDPLGRTFAGVRDGDLCNTQAVRQTFIVWREETAITCQHLRSVTEAL